MKVLRLLAVLFFVTGLMACQQAGPRASSGVSDISALFDSILEQERQWAGLQTRQKQVRGLTVTYSEGGPANAETLVLLHGFSGDRNNWNRMARYLSKDYHLIIPDLPGHGSTSSALEQDYSMAEMAAVMRGLIDALGIQKYHLAGNSMGGGLAIQWAVLRPHQIQSLALIDSAGLYENNPSELMQQLQEGRNELLVQQPGDLNKVLRLAMEDVPFFPRELLAVMEQRQIERLPVYQKIMDSLTQTQQQMGPGAFSVALRSLRAPVLILWGDQDRIFDVSVIKELEANLKYHKTVILPGIGHVPIYETPRVSARVYRDFLTRRQELQAAKK